MVIHDFDVPGVPVAPFETQPPLIIDAYAVLPDPVCAQGFEPIAGRRLEIVERASVGQHLQLARGNSGNGREAPRPARDVQCFGVFARE